MSILWIDSSYGYEGEQEDMSVKLMTSDTIRADLQALALTWPDGIPPEQVDRVNALRGELKRRGEDPNVAASIPTSAVLTAQLPIGQMRQDDLEKELRDLSDRLGKKPDDEAAQNRFADVRFELRRRMKSSPPTDAPATPPPPPDPRALELPDEDEVELRRREREAADAAQAAIDRRAREVARSKNVDIKSISKPDRISMEELSARAAAVGTKLHTKKAISPTGGFSATAVSVAGFPKVVIEFERKGPFGFVCIAPQLTIAEAKAHVAQVQAAIADAEASNRLSGTIVDVSDDE